MRRPGLSPAAESTKFKTCTWVVGALTAAADGLTCNMLVSFGALALLGQAQALRRGCLQVPGDVEIVAAAMKRDRKARLAVPICPSTFEADIASMHGTLLGCIDMLTS